MTPAVISVLTRGLTCGATTACQGGTTMTAGWFTLYCGDTPPLPPAINTGGGSHAHTNALSGDTGYTSPMVTYPASAPDLVYLDPKNVMGKRVPVKISFKMGEKEVEKIYTVPVNKAKVLIKMMNFVTTYKKKISVSMTNFRSKKHNISAVFRKGRAFISKRNDFD